MSGRGRQIGRLVYYVFFLNIIFLSFKTGDTSHEWTAVEILALKTAGHTADPSTDVGSAASVVETTGNTGGSAQQARLLCASPSTHDTHVSKESSERRTMEKYNITIYIHIYVYLEHICFLWIFA